MKCTHEQKLELYNQGLTDMEIAKLLGVSVSNVNVWRRQNNLPLHRSNNFAKLPKEEEQKRLALYKKGFADIDIAKKCGVGVSAITGWRRERGLESNTAKKRMTLYGRSFFTEKVLET